MKTKTELDPKFEYPDNPTFAKQFWRDGLGILIIAWVLMAGMIWVVMTFRDWLTANI
jgi:hypothetical protein